MTSENNRIGVIVSDRTKLLFFAGSTRQDSWNKKLAKLGARLAEERDIESTFIDLADYPMGLYDGDTEQREGPPENAKKLKAIMETHQGVFIASPEYNSGVTPLLKNTLDWVSRVRGEGEAPLQIYKTRVFSIGAASPGGFGGMRSLIMLRQVLSIGLGAMVLPSQIAVPRAHEAFDESGDLKDTGQRDMFSGLVGQLALMSDKLTG